MKITKILFVILAAFSFSSELYISDDLYPEWSKNFNSLEKTQVGPSCQTFAVINAFRACITYSDPDAEELNAQKYFENCSYKETNRFIHSVLNEVIDSPPKTLTGKTVKLESISKGIEYKKEVKLGGFSTGNYSLVDSLKLLEYLDASLKEGPVLASINLKNLDYKRLTKRQSRDFSSPLIEKRVCTNDPNRDDHNHAILILNQHFKHPGTNEKLYEIMDSNLQLTYFLTKAELKDCAMHELYSIKCSSVKILDNKRKKRRLI